MKRIVLVLVFLGVLGLASGSALAYDHGNSHHHGWGYYGYHHPYHTYYRPPRVVLPPPPVVPWYSAYGSYYRPGGCVPYNYGTLRIYPNGLWLGVGF